MTEEARQPQQSGRNFLDAIKGEKDDNRKKIMQKGDYINMPWKVFGRWSTFPPDGKQEDRSAFPTEGDAKVKVVEILKAEGEPTHIIVEADGIQRDVDASLFFNYGIVHMNTELEHVSSKHGLLLNGGNNE